MTGRNGTAPRSDALLVLADGEVFEGEAMGADPAAPGLGGEGIAFTYPHIGNYGVNPTDDEAVRPHCRGIIVRALSDRPSSWRSTATLEEFLVRHGIPGITGVDTRRLTRHLRDKGTMPCAFGTASESDLLRAAQAADATDGHDLV